MAYVCDVRGSGGQTEYRWLWEDSHHTGTKHYVLDQYLNDVELQVLSRGPDKLWNMEDKKLWAEGTTWRRLSEQLIYKVILNSCSNSRSHQLLLAEEGCACSWNLPGALCVASLICDHLKTFDLFCHSVGFSSWLLKAHVEFSPIIMFGSDHVDVCSRLFFPVRFGFKCFPATHLHPGKHGHKAPNVANSDNMMADHFGENSI